MSLPGEGAFMPPDVAAEVRDFYDRYPYPQPVEGLEGYRQRWQDPQRRRAEFHLCWPRRAYREDASILIAGCGTSQAAKHAVRWPGARVVGIDFSETSVRCTEGLKRRYGLDHLEVRRLALERVGELGECFDQIVCTGVLHHLADPDAGLAALRSVLKEDGAMHLMVYAPYGRSGVYMLQDFCRRVGITATDEGIRELIAALGVLPGGHPLGQLLREAPDFRHEAAIADALLHPQDRAYSVPRFFEFIGRAGLSFGRWLRQAPYSPRCGVLARIPQAARMAQLPSDEQYAAAELFRGTMVRHSAIVYRNDAPGNPEQVALDGDAWPAYVPVRMPDTIAVQERLPAGAAAVLINRSHTYTDLIVPIDATEKRLFDAIDGCRTIAQIADAAAPEARPGNRHARARDLFERLEWYDQVVFDASGCAPSL
jgi:2-polyprenyl-3-methyl-5-hydroxy-6-metoxy-1,4-benzoquinol methylase